MIWSNNQHSNRSPMMATEIFGCVCSFNCEPEFKQGAWLDSIVDNDPCYIFLAGTISRLDENVARSSLRYYSNS